MIDNFIYQKGQLIIDSKQKKELKITYECKHAKG